MVSASKKDDFVADEALFGALANTFKALSDTTRIRIIHLLLGGEMCVGDIADEIRMSNSVVSHQLRILRNLRLVKVRRDGKNAIYSLDDVHIGRLFKEGMKHVTDL